MDLTGLEPVERRSTATVADRLRVAIMRGTFPPGAQLGEVELTTRLGVSLRTLREAMQWLVAEGLLCSVRNRGLFVRDLDAADVRDVYAARGRRAGRRTAVDSGRLGCGRGAAERVAGRDGGRRG